MKVNLVNENFRADYLKNLLATRGIKDIKTFLDPPSYYLSDPILLDNIQRGAIWLEDALNK